jgi:hypothetical protein
MSTITLIISAIIITLLFVSCEPAQQKSIDDFLRNLSVNWKPRYSTLGAWLWMPAFMPSDVNMRELG